MAGLSSQIDVLLGPGLSILPQLRAEVTAGKRPLYDFVFIDADKQNNLAYFNLALEMSRPGAGIYVDNVVRKGKLADPEDPDERVVATREMVAAIGRDERVDAVVIQTLSSKNYDGFLMAVKK